MTSTLEAAQGLLCALTRPGDWPLPQWNRACMQYSTKECAKDVEITGFPLILCRFGYNLLATTFLIVPACVVMRANSEGTQAILGLWASLHSRYICTVMLHSPVFFGRANK